MGVHRRFYDTDWQQEGAHRPAGPLSRHQQGARVNAEASGRHWSEPGRDVERGIGPNVSRRALQTMRMARARRE